MSKRLIIEGGCPLKGAVRLGGAKNASFKLMIASLLAKGETRLLNFSKIADVQTTKDIICLLGGKIRKCGERTLLIDTSLVNRFAIPEKWGRLSRASTMFIGPLLSRFNKAVVPFPGGDKIGPRPLERHFKGLEKFGVSLKVKRGVIEAGCSQLVGANYRFDKNTHTGTEALIMTAVLAKGKTTLENAAEEPEVDDLIEFLNKMGAKVKRRTNRRIDIYGVAKLEPVIYQIMPDRNEAVSYAVAAIMTKGDIVVENARSKDLRTFLEKLEEAGGGFEVGNYGIRFFYKKPLSALDIVTQPYPGFMTDWQPLWAVLATQLRGITTIIETIYLSRFGYVKDLRRMGAEISFFHPTVDDPGEFYNFNLENDWQGYPHGIQIKGSRRLKGIKAKISDLRAGATLVLAGLVTDGGETVLEGVEHIDRGYEDLDGRLRQLGAKIKRLEGK